MLSVVRMTFGSHLYGTDTPASDHDFKGVHVPSAQDILLQRVKKAVVSNTKDDPTVKNTAADVDETSFSLQAFLNLTGEGNTTALDMLFAPREAWTQRHWLWEQLVDMRHRLLCKQAASFVGYCRSQANKYGIRGSRVAAARKALDFLIEAERLNTGLPRLGMLAEPIGFITAATEHMELVNIPSQAGTDVMHWSVCERKMPFTASIKSAREIMERVVAAYGHRALAAEKNEGVDWKALSHAVRVGEEALELLQHAHITFPRPEAPYLVRIKLGEIPFARVGADIERLLIEVEDAAKVSKLPDKADGAFIDQFVLEAHHVVVRNFIP